MKDSAPLHRADFWRQLRYDLIWAYRGTVPPHLRRGFMQGYVLSAWYILQGRAELTINGHTAFADTGQWLFAAPGGREQNLSDDIQMISIRYFVGRYPGLYFFKQLRSIIVAHEEAPQLLENANRLVEVSQKRINSAERGGLQQLCTAEEFLEVQSIFLRWLAEYIQAASRRGLQPTASEQGDDRIVKALNLVGQDARSYALSEGRVAAHVGLSLSHFRRLFQAQTGKTWKQICDDARLDSTFAALRLTPNSIKQIAFAHGFRSSQNFSAWFHAKAGQSPSEYRERFYWTEDRLSPHPGRS